MHSYSTTSNPWLYTTAASSTANIVTLRTAPMEPPAPFREDEFAWLRRRVDEVVSEFERVA